MPGKELVMTGPNGDPGLGAESAGPLPQSVVEGVGGLAMGGASGELVRDDALATTRPEDNMANLSGRSHALYRLATTGPFPSEWAESTHAKRR